MSATMYFFVAIIIIESIAIAGLILWGLQLKDLHQMMVKRLLQKLERANKTKNETWNAGTHRSSALSLIRKIIEVHQEDPLEITAMHEMLRHSKAQKRNKEL